MPNSDLRNQLETLNAQRRPLGAGMDLDKFVAEVRDLHLQVVSAGEVTLLDDAEDSLEVAERYLWGRSYLCPGQ